jgi:hypothetical protein
MENSDPRQRSYLPITHADLARLLALAQQDRRQFFARNPGWAPYYADRILGTALCQGAAWHYVRGEVGINDFDVYTFYAANPARTWYAKRIARLDFGNPKFGCSEISSRGYIGRRVDLLGRALNVPVGSDLAESLRGTSSRPKRGLLGNSGRRPWFCLNPGWVRLSGRSMESGEYFPQISTVKRASVRQCS